MQYRRLPRSLAIRIRNFHEHLSYNTCPFDERAILDTLSPQLQQETIRYLLADTILRVPVIAELDSHFHMSLFDKLMPNQYSHRHTIFVKGEVSHEIMFLLEGAVDAISPVAALPNIRCDNSPTNCSVVTLPNIRCGSLPYLYPTLPYHTLPYPTLPPTPTPTLPYPYPIPIPTPTLPSLPHPYPTPTLPYPTPYPAPYPTPYPVPVPHPSTPPLTPYPTPYRTPPHPTLPTPTPPYPPHPTLPTPPYPPHTNSCLSPGFSHTLRRSSVLKAKSWLRCQLEATLGSRLP